MIPMRKISHTWFLLAILFTLDYSGVKMQADVPLPAGLENRRFEILSEQGSGVENCEKRVLEDCQSGTTYTGAKLH